MCIIIIIHMYSKNQCIYIRNKSKWMKKVLHRQEGCEAADGGKIERK